MLINVTAECIANGKPYRSQCCPIALAVKNIFPDARMSVGPGTIYVSFPGLLIMDVYFNDRRFDVPLIARKFMREFDQGNPVEPFSFEATERIAL